MKELVKKWKSFFTDDKKIKIIVIIGLIGMGLILISSYFPRADNENTSESINNGELSYDDELEIYTAGIEEKLRMLLENISGVGKVEVMITVSCSQEYVYAEEEKSSISGDSDSFSEQWENKYIIVEQKNGKEALLKKIKNPQISGVVVVCEGGDSNVVLENVYRAVSTALELPTNRIYVTKIK